MKARAAVILIQGDKIALIERHRSGRHYFVFPGGKIEPGETAAEAAAREILEELGLEVKIGPLVAEVWYHGSPQYYFLAEILGGQFGSGKGREMASPLSSQKGAYLPVWMAVDEITAHPALPRLMAEYVHRSYQSGWPAQPLVVTDQPPDEQV